MQDPRISWPPFFRFYMEIYFVERNLASVRQLNRRSVSVRSVLRSNQAATVWLRPSYRPVTVSLIYRPHHWTAIWIMIQTRPSDRAVVARLSPPNAAAWPLACLLLPGICSVVCLPVGRPSACKLAWQLQRFHRPPPLCRSPTLSASPIIHPSPVRWYQVACQIPAETQLLSIVRCSHSLA